jgi:arylformamidase
VGFVNVIDVSWPISEKMTVYKDRQEKRPVITQTRAITNEGPDAAESKLAFDSHLGTHVDAPKHFVKGGTSIDRVPLATYVGMCAVYDLTHVQEKITQADLEKLSISAGGIVLFKTKNSALAPEAPFNPDFVFIDAGAAAYLASRKIKAVGIDYPGIERSQPNHETHLALLRNNIGILEGLRLQHVAPGNYFVVAAPLSVKDGDAGLCRALLIEGL